MRVNYGAGLAAPQIGFLRRVCIISSAYVPSLPKDPSYEGFVILTNPELTPLGEEKFAWKEACLSIDDFTAFVKRHKNLRVKYQNSLGEEKEVTVSSEESATIQHETDHLEGKLFIHRLEGFAKTSALNKLKKRLRIKKKEAKQKESAKIGKPKRERKKKKKSFGRKKKK